MKRNEGNEGDRTLKRDRIKEVKSQNSKEKTETKIAALVALIPKEITKNGKSAGI